MGLVVTKQQPIKGYCASIFDNLLFLRIKFSGTICASVITDALRERGVLEIQLAVKARKSANIHSVD